jgi:hypothetical protein
MATPRRPGRPVGSLDLHGKAKRVDQRRIPVYLDRVRLKIRALRLEQDVSVDELAQASGMGRHGLWKIESGETSANLRSIVRIALALGIQPSELLP